MIVTTNFSYILLLWSKKINTSVDVFFSTRVFMLIYYYAGIASFAFIFVTFATFQLKKLLTSAMYFLGDTR